jgi:hypothetical protein
MEWYIDDVNMLYSVPITNKMGNCLKPGEKYLSYTIYNCNKYLNIISMNFF